MKRVLSLMILATSVLIAQPESNVPSNMSFQGLLTDTEGIAYDDGEYQLTFRLIREMNDGTEQTVWEESHSTNVTNGVFTVVLGSENPLPLNISPNVLLETQVGDEILSPRQPLTSVPFALKSSRSQQAYQSVISDTALYAMQAHHSQFSDTAMVSLNAPMADTAQFAYNSQHATHSDSAMFTANSQHAVHADTASVSTISETATHAGTADYVINAPSPISVYDEFFSINNSQTFNTNSIVEVVDTIFESTSLNFFLQGIINYNYNQNSAKTEILFAPISDFGENDDGDVYFLNELPFWEETRLISGIGQVHNASQNSDDLNNPQITFFFYINPEFQNTAHRLVIRKAYGTASSDMKMWGKLWGQ